MNIRPVTQYDVDNDSSLVASLANFYLKEKESELPEWFSRTLNNSEFIKRVDSPGFSNYLCEIDGSSGVIC